MLIEFAGCSGSGKTTLSREVLGRLRGQNGRVRLASNVIARKGWVSWCPNERMRNLLLNATLLPKFIHTGLRQSECFRLSSEIIRRESHDSAEWVSCYRSTMRLLTTDLILRKHAQPSNWVLVDEGILGCIHNLFAFPNRTEMPDLSEVDRFLETAPLPDLIVHVTAPLEVVLDRTLRRRDRPFRRDPSRERCAAFLRQALFAFDHAVRHPRIRDKVLIVENTEHNGCLDRHAAHAMDFLRARAGMECFSWFQDE